MNGMEDPDSMIAVTAPPPQEVAADLAQLRAVLDRDIPAKALDRNLLIATWNVRAFGDLTQNWESSEEDTPKRDLHSLLSIAEIVSRFDVVVAVQEAKDPIPLPSPTFPPVRRTVSAGGSCGRDRLRVGQLDHDNGGRELPRHPALWGATNIWGRALGRRRR
jgi:hypothetical protein